MLYNYIMCNNKVAYLRISNRGAGVDTLVANQRFSVNLPANLRSRGPCNITVVDGLVAITTQAGVNIMKSELGVLSNIPMYGFNCETPAGSNNFMSVNNNILFQCDLSTFAQLDGTAGLVRNQMLNPRTFYSQGLPERIEFERYQVDNLTTVPYAIDNYISFTLKIDFIDIE